MCLFYGVGKGIEAERGSGTWLSWSLVGHPSSVPLPSATPQTPGPKKAFPCWRGLAVPDCRPPQARAQLSLCSQDGKNLVSACTARCFENGKGGHGHLRFFPNPSLDSPDPDGWRDHICILGSNCLFPSFVPLPPAGDVVTSQEIMPVWFCPDKPFRPYL